MRYLENENLIFEQIKELTQSLNKLNERIPKIINEIIIPKTISQPILSISEFLTKKKKILGKMN